MCGNGCCSSELAWAPGSVLEPQGEGTGEAHLSPTACRQLSGQLKRSTQKSPSHCPPTVWYPNLMCCQVAVDMEGQMVYQAALM